MFFETFDEVYEGSSVVYSVEALLCIKEAENQYMRPFSAREILTVMRRVPERLESTYHRPHSISKVPSQYQ